MRFFDCIDGLLDYNNRAAVGGFDESGDSVGLERFNQRLDLGQVFVALLYADDVGEFLDSLGCGGLDGYDSEICV